MATTLLSSGAEVSGIPTDEGWSGWFATINRVDNTLVAPHTGTYSWMLFGASAGLEYAPIETPSGRYVFEAWVRYPSGQTSGLHVPICIDYYTTSLGAYVTTSGQLALCYRDNGTITPLGPGTGQIQLNQWARITLTVDYEYNDDYGGGTFTSAKLELDGAVVQNSTGISIGDAIASVYPMVGGDNGSGTSQPLFWFVDDVLVTFEPAAVSHTGSAAVTGGGGTSATAAKQGAGTMLISGAAGTTSGSGAMGAVGAAVASGGGSLQVEAIALKPAAVTYVGQSLPVDFGPRPSATSTVVGYPTDAAGPPWTLRANDVLVAMFATRDNRVLAFPAGWTIKAQFNSGANLRLTIAWMRLTADTTGTENLTVSHAAGGGSIHAMIHCFRGCRTIGDPFEASVTRANGFGAGSGTWGSIAYASTSDNAWLLHAIASAENTPAGFTPSAPAGLTNIIERDEFTGNQISGAFYTALDAVAGAGTSPAITWAPAASATSAEWVGALSPEPAVQRYVILQGGGQLIGEGVKGNTDAPVVLGGGSVEVAPGSKSARNVATITGSGTIAVAAGLSVSATAIVTGGGSIALAGHRGNAESIVVSGGGSIVVAGAMDDKNAEGVALVTGGGALTGSALKSVPGTVGVTGAGSTTATCRKGVNAAPNIIGGGSINVIANRFVGGHATVLGAGSLIATGRRDIRGESWLGGGGTPLAQGKMGGKGAAVGSGNGTIHIAYAASKPLERSGAAVLAGGGSPSVVSAKGVEFSPTYTANAIVPQYAPSADRHYRFVLAESETLAPIGVLRGAAQRKLELVLNRGGSASFTLPITDPLADDIEELTTCVIVYCDNEEGYPVARWSGPVWTIDKSAGSQSGTMSVSCVGWQEILNYREIRERMVFTNLDATLIAQRLVSTANNTVANGQIPENLVTNGSFEADLAYWSGPYGSRGAGGAPLVYNDVSFHGSKSLYMSSVNANATYYFLNDTMAIPGGRATNVAAPGPYTVSADIYISNLVGTAYAQIYVEFLNSAGATLQVFQNQYNWAGQHKENNTITAPAGTAYVKVYPYIYTGPSGTIEVVFDNIVVTPGSNVGFQNTNIVPGDWITTQNRTRTYEIGQKIGTAIQELSDIEAGFDYKVDPLTRVMSWHYDVVKGTIRGIGQDRTDCVWGYNWGPRNVQAVSERIDSSRTANRVNARGKYGVGMAQDTAAIDYYGLFEESIALSDVADNAILARFAGGEVAYRLRPVKTYNFTPFPWDGTNKVPRIFIDYDIGDIVYLTAKDGALDIEKQAIRIFGASIEIDENGVEKVTSLQTAAS